jgi:hypothetical protein
MARVVAFVPDLVFGSRVVAAVRSAGHEPVLASSLEALGEELAGAAAVIVDLTYDAVDRIEQLRLRRPAGVRTLAFYSHVETDVAARAQEAGFDIVVPRSRMAREGSALVSRLLDGPE